MTPDRSSPDRTTSTDVEGATPADAEGSDSGSDADSDSESGSDPDSGSDPGEAADELPFDGTVLVQAGALASVPLSRLPGILRPLQRHLGDRIDQYRREYERVLREPDRELFLVDPSHWDVLASDVGLDDRARDAARRTHEAQLTRSGSVHDRRAEFEAALEIRSVVVIGADDD
ncbi:hypothetical protein SAMN05192561_103132 [Halopenitus malekzadehii]|uniref:DUF8048 domain-containing protein n=1 Tax=Halopenitus malekzadehii TaxID=1267564 RepID=A0A1H6IK57_9EURY|nr:hypothetical protein [Halopenitus malekzadehii]SEH49839.1 hypothetical protein SAMN05192561_103132 [Halopenitus malekzadehii]